MGLTAEGKLKLIVENASELRQVLSMADSFLMFAEDRGHPMEHRARSVKAVAKLFDQIEVPPPTWQEICDMLRATTDMLKPKEDKPPRLSDFLPKDLDAPLQEHPLRPEVQYDNAQKPYVVMLKRCGIGLEVIASKKQTMEEAEEFGKRAEEKLTNIIAFMTMRAINIESARKWAISMWIHEGYRLERHA